MKFSVLARSAYLHTAVLYPLLEAEKTNIALNPTVSLRYPILLILDDFFAELSIIQVGAEMLSM